MRARTITVVSDPHGGTMQLGVTSDAGERYARRKERENVLRWLGMQPEGKSAGERYPATIGELVRWLRERA